MRDAGHLAEEIKSPSPLVVADLFLSSGECIGIFSGLWEGGGGASDTSHLLATLRRSQQKYRPCYVTRRKTQSCAAAHHPDLNCRWRPVCAVRFSFGEE